MSTDASYYRNLLAEADRRTAEEKIARANLEAEAAATLARTAEEQATRDARERVRRGAWMNSMLTERVARGETDILDLDGLEKLITDGDTWPEGDGPDRHGIELRCAENAALRDANVVQSSMTQWAAKFGIKI